MMTDEQIERIAANSYRNFHAKGFDYLCLSRSPEETVKVYFFEGDVSVAPEVVVPHDHRYDFVTQVLAGEVANHLYRETVVGMGRTFERFEYRTPLNGGDGFKWRETVALALSDSGRYFPGDCYSMSAWEIHTITVRPDTVLMLTQYEDILPIDVATRAYRPAGMREPISLDGLYRRMDEDHVRMRLRQLETLAPDLHVSHPIRILTASD